MSFKSFLRKLRAKRVPAIPAPPLASDESLSPANKPRRRYLRWVVVLVLGTGIAAARLYYPDILGEAVQFADALWPPDTLVAATPVAAGTPTPEAVHTPTPAALTASPTSTPVLPEPEAAVPASAVGSGTDLPAELETGADVEAVPPSHSGPDNGQIQTAVFATGMQMTGRSREPYITLWSYPGPSTGHLAVHRYEVSTLFEVVESDRTMGDYPVELNGLSWLRVQAEDGLVGWVKSSELEEAGGIASR